MRSALFLAALLLCFLSLVVADDAPLVIETRTGLVQGVHSTYSGSTARAWLGIPYASPPNDTRRFHAPMPAPSWSGTLDASKPGPGCQQDCILPPGLCPAVQSEDCLYLNVFAPAEVTQPEPMAVLVYIHGGNFRQGEGASGMYDGTVMANRSSVLVVTMNYRLGALGFFFGNASTANNGLLDQQMALRWVQQNIAAFGGDPRRVTLSGQSAGGTSVACHLQNPLSRDMFSAAIIQSIPMGIPVRQPHDAAKLNAIFAAELKCATDDMSCLQSRSVPQLLEAQRVAANAFEPHEEHILLIAQSWQPTIEMSSFPVALQPWEFFQKYDGERPLMFGTTSEEVYVFIYEAVQKPMDLTAALALEAVVFGLDSLGPLGELYPLSDKEDNRPAISMLGTEALFGCPTRNASDGLTARDDDAAVWLYVFDHVSADGEHGWGPKFRVCWDKVCHGSEVPYVFASAEAAGSQFIGADELQLAQRMLRYWANFAKSGNPNKGDPVDVEWPTAGRQRNTMMLRADKLAIEKNFRGKECDYFDTLGYML